MWNIDLKSKLCVEYVHLHGVQMSWLLAEFLLLALYSIQTMEILLAVQY